MAARLGVDIGGTFTDLVVVDETTGAVRVGKVLTTPKDPAHGVEQGIQGLLGEAGVAAGAVGAVVHGTTLATNALIERKGAKTALLTTAGFRDTLEIRSEGRYDMYDLFIDPPAPLVPRHLRYEVPERLLADGSELRPPDEAEARRVIASLVDEGVKLSRSACCRLHQPVHRAAARRDRTRNRAGPAVSCSSDSCRRSGSTSGRRRRPPTSNVVPLMALPPDLEHRMVDLGCRASSTSCSPLVAIAVPEERATCRSVSSSRARPRGRSPRPGAPRARRVALLSFDMGGTTAKACVIDDGVPLVAREFEVAPPDRFKRARGCPCACPSSNESRSRRRRFDRPLRPARAPQVGPDSATPPRTTPLVLRSWRTAPTVTDRGSDPLLSRRAVLPGGRMRLDRQAAARAIEEQSRGRSALTSARRVGYPSPRPRDMAAAARIHGIELGKDPARIRSSRFGGAGPFHCWQVAHILRVPRILLPFGAGAMSAYGLLAAPLAFDFVRTHHERLDAPDWPAVNRLLAEMEAEGCLRLARAGVAAADVRIKRVAEMRYLGQGHEVEAALPAGPLSHDSLEAITSSFEAAYRALYHRLPQGVPIETLNWRVTTAGPAPEVTMRQAAQAGGGTRSALKRTRRAWFAETDAYVDPPSTIATRQAGTSSGAP